MSNQISTLSNRIVNRRTLLNSLLVAATLFVGMTFAPSARAQAPAPGIYRVATITGHRQQAGNFAPQTRARFQGTAIQINANGTFVIALPGTWYGTMQGKLVRSGSGYTFKANRSYSTGYSGLTVASISGNISVVNGQVRMTLTSRSGNNLAAVVNNTNFSSSVSNAWVGSASMQRVK